MRILPLLLVFLAVGCAGRKKAYSEVDKRDYYSVNKSSVKFLGRTFKEDPRMVRESFRNNWSWSELRRQNARLQKSSVKFLGESLVALEKDNAKHAWTVGLPRELRDKKDFWRSVRFGFLDSGE